jgi:hypothetical protein
MVSISYDEAAGPPEDLILSTDGLGVPHRAGVIGAIETLANQSDGFVWIAVGQNVVCTTLGEREPLDHNPRRPRGGVPG